MDLFGESVSISGDYAVVGVPGHDVWPYINSGSAFVYRRDGENWTEQAMLVADDAGGGDDFGHSVAIDGDYIIVGAPGDDPQSSAYVFMRNGADWTQQAKLTGSRGAQCDKFGHSVAIDGAYAIVGDPEDTKGGAGSAYIFVRSGTNWSQEAKLSGTDGEAFDEFGSAVAIDGDRAVVGAPGQSPKDPFSHRAGVGHIYGRAGAGWSLEAMLRAAEPKDIDIPEYRAGTSVAISGDSVVLGAIGSDGSSVPGVVLAGAAYLYTAAGGDWKGVEKLVPGDGIEWHYFGCAVAIDGGCTIVGANLSNPLAHESGAAYAFGVAAAQQPATGPPKIAVDPLEDHLFWDDDGSFQLTISHAGSQVGTGGGQQGGGPATVEVTVHAPPGFLEGDLVTQTFRLSPKEKKQFDVEVVDLLPLIRNFERDVLFGANVQIRAWPEGDPQTLVFEDEFNIYRYLDAGDAQHDDRSMSLAPTFRDGRDGDAIRKRQVELWGVHAEAEAEFEIDPAEEFRVEMATGSATFIFDPSAGDQSKLFIEDIQVRNKRKDRLAGLLFIEGKGTPTQKIFLNKRGLVRTLGQLANRLWPEYHVHTALFTDDEAALLRSRSVRQRIADRVEARMVTLLAPVSPAIQIVQNAGDRKTTTVYSWPTRLNGPRTGPGPIPISADFWPERIGELEKVTHPTVGPFGHAGEVDDANAMYRHVHDRGKYSRAELHYRLATVMNMTPAAAIDVFVDSILEHVGTGEPLTLDEDQLVNAVAKTALHELGHTLGALHTAAVGVEDIAHDKLEQQRITWNGGQPDSWFILGFNGTEMVGPLPRDATGDQIVEALCELRTIWGPNVMIPTGRSHEGDSPRWVEVRIGNVFEGADVPLLTAWSGDKNKPTGNDPNALLDVWVEAVTEGQVGNPTIVTKNGVQMLLHSTRGGIRGDTDIMTGGMNDIAGQLRFQPGLGLSGIRIGLHLSYDEQEMDDYAQFLDRHWTIAPRGF